MRAYEQAKQKIESQADELQLITQKCASLYDAIQTHPVQSHERKLAVRAYLKANGQRSALRRAHRIANKTK